MQPAPPSAVARRIKEAREAQGIKQNALAKMLDVSPPAVHAWERGDDKGYMPPHTRWQAIADALGTSIEALFFDTEAAAG